MADKRPALGRGLSALIPSAPPPVRQDAAPARPSDLDIDLLTPNPRQPRVYLDETRLEELAQSIRSHGVIQPILVRRVGDRTEIVAGERRWRAAQRAGLLKVPVVYRDVPDEHLL
jgi:ParB family chromosome partitioning protein